MNVFLNPTHYVMEYNIFNVVLIVAVVLFVRDGRKVVLQCGLFVLYRWQLIVQTY